MKRFGQILFILMFIGTVFAMPILTKLEKTQATSQFENRKLADAPVLTRDSLISGKYFSSWETYLSDHIYKRNYWIKGYTYMNMFFLDKSKINNVVIGKNGYLLPFFSYNAKYDAENNREKIINMTQQMKELQNHIEKKGGSFYFVGIPEQSSFHRDKYPEYFNNNEEVRTETEKLMFDNLDKQGISYINMNKIFRADESKEYYFKSDHHYSLEGAYSTYQQIMNELRKDAALNIQPALEKADLDIITLPNSFVGSRNRQIYNLYNTDEHIQIAYQNKKISYDKFTNDKREDKLYYVNDNKNAEMNYNVYMGGDWAETVINTHNEKLPRLLLFGDSFTNAIEPLLYYHFDETRIVDLRHYNKMSLYEYIDKYKPDVVIMVRDDINYSNPKGNGSFKGETK